MKKNKKIIFLKYSLLEELEATNKGNVSADKVLTLVNSKKYQLEEAVIFKAVLEGNNQELLNKILTNKEIEEKGYDMYMDTIIVDDTVYQVEEGFKGILIQDSATNQPQIKENEFKKEEKTSEQLLADLMLGF
jgi:hypothetical protein